jgi:peptidoglycan hydrolase-like protein with peptidoglycan-binding domain
MHKFSVIAIALAIGLAWSFGPAFAADATEKAADTTDKAESTKDTIKDKAEHAKDAIKDKAESATDTIKDKAVRAKAKIKEKIAHARDTMRSKTERGDGRVAMSDTRAAQEALMTQGFDPGPIDGRMGPRTRAAVSDYQRKNDLPVTGMLDDATMSKLNVRSSRAADVPAASPTTQPDPKKQSQ